MNTRDQIIQKKNEVDQKKLAKDISNTVWPLDEHNFFEEACRLREFENARKEVADTKSKVFIGILLALAPISLTVLNLSWSKELLSQNTGASSTAVTLLYFALIYFFAALFFAFKINNVRTYHRVDIEDLLKFAKTDKKKLSLMRGILLSVLLNRDTVNEKIELVKVTQGHILRMVICIFFSIFLLHLPILTDHFRSLCKVLKLSFCY